MSLVVRRNARRRATPAAWVLGGGGARGAAQLGVIQALLETQAPPPTAIFGTSVGALDGAVIAALPTPEGTELLRELWLSKPARGVFHVRTLGAVLSPLGGRLGILSPGPLRALIDEFESATGCTRFEDLAIPLRVVATEMLSGSAAVFRSGALAPALLASTAIPGVFPPVPIGRRTYCDGGIVENLPISLAVDEGYGRILAVGVMAGGELDDAPSTWTEVIGRTLQLSLHHRLLSDFQRLRQRARIAVICPITPAASAWDMRLAHVEWLIERAYAATRELLEDQAGRLFDRSAIHYLDLRGPATGGSSAGWLARAV